MQARSLATEEFIWWKVDRSVNRVDPSNNGQAPSGTCKREHLTLTTMHLARIQTGRNSGPLSITLVPGHARRPEAKAFLQETLMWGCRFLSRASYSPLRASGVLAVAWFSLSLPAIWRCIEAACRFFLTDFSYLRINAWVCDCRSWARLP